MTKIDFRCQNAPHRLRLGNSLCIHAICFPKPFPEGLVLHSYELNPPIIAVLPCDKFTLDSRFCSQMLYHCRQQVLKVGV